MTHHETLAWFRDNPGPDNVAISAPRRTACGLPANVGAGRPDQGSKKRGKK
jgi:hypothetical protein